MLRLPRVYLLEVTVKLCRIFDSLQSNLAKQCLVKKNIPTPPWPMSNESPSTLEDDLVVYCKIIQTCCETVFLNGLLVIFLFLFRVSVFLLQKTVWFKLALWSIGYFPYEEFASKHSNNLDDPPLLVSHHFHGSLVFGGSIYLSFSFYPLNDPPQASF